MAAFAKGRSQGWIEVEKKKGEIKSITVSRDRTRVAEKVAEVTWKYHILHLLCRWRRLIKKVGWVSPKHLIFLQLSCAQFNNYLGVFLHAYLHGTTLDLQTLYHSAFLPNDTAGLQGEKQFHKFNGRESSMRWSCHMTLSYDMILGG